AADRPDGTRWPARAVAGEQVARRAGAAGLLRRGRRDGALVARIVFFGTPELAVPSLEALCDAGMSPGLVVSRPDRPVGRGHRMASPPVVEAARARGLEV